MCGWGSAQDAKVTDCYFAPQCARPAKLRTDRYGVKGQLLALCFECSDRLHAERAEQWCRAHDLNTVSEKRAYCQSLSRSFGKPFVDEASPEREPGEDREEAA